MVMKAYRVLVWLLIAVLIVFTVVFSVAKEFLEDVADFQPDIEQFVSAQTGLNVRAASLGGHWIGMRPVLEIHDLAVRKDETLPALFQAKSIRIQWLAFASFLNLEPRVKLWVDGATLELVFNDGYLLPAGIPPPEPDYVSGDENEDDVRTANLRLIDFINRQPHLELSNSEVTVEGLWETKAVLGDADILMVNRFGYREIDGTFDLSGPSQSKVQMYARVQGALANLNTLQGQYYLKMDNAELVPWIPPDLRTFEHLAIENAEGAVELWAKVKQGAVHRVTANVALENVSVQNLKDGNRESLRVAKGTLLYQRLSDEKSHIVFSDFHMEHALFQWTPNLLSLGVTRKDDDSWLFDVGVDEIEIAPWVQYYVALSDPASDMHQLLLGVSPTGRFNNLKAQATLREGVLQDMRASGQLSDLVTQSHEQLPGVDRLHIDFDVADTEGVVSVSSDNILLDYPVMFRESLAIQHVDGSFRFEKTDVGLYVESGLIAVNNGDLRTVTQLSFQHFTDRAISPRIQLLSTLRGLDTVLLPTYLPTGVLPESLTAFLDRSVRTGHVVRGDILFNGPLDWKRQDEDLNMQLGFMADNTEFEYLPDWEPVKGAQADVIVDRVFVDTYATKGSCYGLALDHAVVTTREASSEDVFRLAVDATLQGDAAQGMGVLRQSPLNTVVGDAVKEMEVTGALSTDLNVTLLLGSDDPDIAVDLGLALADVDFAMPEQAIEVKNIQGDLGFDLVQGLTATALTGRSFGGDLEASIVPTFEGEVRQATVIHVEGKAALARVNEWLDVPLLKRVTGESAYQASITLPVAENVLPVISVSSTLSGVNVDLPSPLTKKPDVEKPLHIESMFGENMSTLQVAYGDKVAFAAEQAGGHLTKFNAMFGGAKAILPVEKGYRLSGQLASIDLQSWVDVLKADGGDTEVGSATDGDLPVEDKPTLLIEEGFLSSQLTLANLDIFGQPFSNLVLDFLPADDTWNVAVNGDGVSAQFELPRYLLKGKRALREQITPIVATFSTLTLADKPTESRNNSAVISDRGTLDPTLLPPIKLSIEHLFLGEEDFGFWDVQLSPIQNGMLIDPLNALVKATNFSGTGRWITNNSNDVKTLIKGKAETTDVADVIRGWGAEPTLDSKRAKASIEANWPGAPYEFDLLTADASMTLEVEDGHFLKVNSGAVDKFWGALNFQTVMKRLQLNFADLNSSDLTFSDIEGELTLADKVLVVDNMLVDSPAVDISLEGKVLLEEEALDMSLDVAIPVTRNLVLPAAAVGGLPAAATAFVIEQVLGDQLNKLTTVKYRVKGTFDNPVVEAKDSFNVIPKPVQDSLLPSGEEAKQPPRTDPDDLRG